MGEEARLQELSEEVETAYIYKSFKNVGCEGELEGHGVEGVFSSFAKIGKTRACLFAAGKELSGREKLETGKRGRDEIREIPPRREKRRLNPQIWLHNWGDKSGPVLDSGGLEQLPVLLSSQCESLGGK